MKPVQISAITKNRNNNLKRSKTIRATLTKADNNLFNVDEMMTKNKLKKFREIKVEGGYENSSSSNTNNNSR